MYVVAAQHAQTRHCGVAAVCCDLGRLNCCLQRYLSEVGKSLPQTILGSNISYIKIAIFPNSLCIGTTECIIILTYLVYIWNIFLFHLSFAHTQQLLATNLFFWNMKCFRWITSPTNKKKTDVTCIFSRRPRRFQKGATRSPFVRPSVAWHTAAVASIQINGDLFSPFLTLQ